MASDRRTKKLKFFRILKIKAAQEPRKTVKNGRFLAVFSSIALSGSLKISGDNKNVSAATPKRQSHQGFAE